MTTSTPTLEPESPSRPTTAPRRATKRGLAITTAAALLVAGGGYAITTAAFTDAETVAGNSVGTASLTIGDTVAKPVSVTDLLPGQTAPATDVLTFENTGSVPFEYTVTVGNIVTSGGSPAELPSWIPVTITAGGQSDTGTLAELPTITVPTLEPDATATVVVTVGLDSNATNTAQGRTATFDLTVTAEQLP